HPRLPVQPGRAGAPGRHLDPEAGVCDLRKPARRASPHAGGSGCRGTAQPVDRAARRGTGACSASRYPSGWFLAPTPRSPGRQGTPAGRAGPQGSTPARVDVPTALPYLPTGPLPGLATGTGPIAWQLLGESGTGSTL